MNLKRTYTFSTKAPSILGSKVERVLLVGICDFERAVKLVSDENLLTQYRRVQTVIPAAPGETLDTFYHFVTASGAVLVLAESWIDMSTVVEVNALALVMTMPNAQLTDVAKVKALLQAAGYTNFEVTTR